MYIVFPYIITYTHPGHRKQYKYILAPDGAGGKVTFSVATSEERLQIHHYVNIEIQTVTDLELDHK